MPTSLGGIIFMFIMVNIEKYLGLLNAFIVEGILIECMEQLLVIYHIIFSYILWLLKNSEENNQEDYLKGDVK